ncbi:hypothetical protein R3P38DRAFT_3219186 [Favolaschia claudopus]|uniref:Uncharacterized protein n=1 Tax=Favolaschia claudopus TaxID=2862362 RepID=A0AAW0A2A4_9AGAR
MEVEELPPTSVDLLKGGLGIMTRNEVETLYSIRSFKSVVYASPSVDHWRFRLRLITKIDTLHRGLGIVIWARTVNDSALAMHRSASAATPSRDTRHTPSRCSSAAPSLSIDAPLPHLSPATTCSPPRPSASCADPSPSTPLHLHRSRGSTRLPAPRPRFIASPSCRDGDGVSRIYTTLPTPALSTQPRHPSLATNALSPLARARLVPFRRGWGGAGKEDAGWGAERWMEYTEEEDGQEEEIRLGVDAEEDEEERAFPESSTA